MSTGRVLATAMLVVLIAVLGALSAVAAPEGQMTWAVHVSLAPTWFDPAETSGIITPYMMLYALHDAVVKPMPGQLMAPSLAESWRLDGRARLRVRPPPRREIPQRRAGDG